MGLTYNYTTGPRTDKGNYPAYQALTAEHFGAAVDSWFTDQDSFVYCQPSRTLAMVEDKANGHTCNGVQLTTLEILDELYRQGSEFLEGRVSIAHGGKAYQMDISYEGLAFCYDQGTKGVDVTYQGSDGAIMTALYGKVRSPLDTIIRNRRGDFMLVSRKLQGEPMPENKAIMHKLAHKLILAGLKASHGKISVPSRQWPLKLRYWRLHLFEHEDITPIEEGRMWWDGRQCSIEEIKQAFGFTELTWKEPKS